MTPDRVLTEVWALLAAAVDDRTAPWRLPVMATTTPEGAPTARTVVLRDVDAAAGRVEIHTDRRSAKARHLAADPRCELVFWDPGLHWQVRLGGTVEMAVEGAAVETVWNRLHVTRRAAYAGGRAPGSPLYSQLDTAHDPRAAFMVLTMTVRHVDWVSLEGPQNRRMIYLRDGARWRGEEVEP